MWHLQGHARRDAGPTSWCRTGGVPAVAEKDTAPRGERSRLRDAARVRQLLAGLLAIGLH